MRKFKKNDRAVYCGENYRVKSVAFVDDRGRCYYKIVSKSNGSEVVRTDRLIKVIS